VDKSTREGILLRIAEAAWRMRRAQEWLLRCESSEEALAAAREEARALRTLDEALLELPHLDPVARSKIAR